MNSMMISFSGWICSIFRTRQRNLVGCWLPPNVPPRCVSIMALSTSVSAVSPKQCSFQYLFRRDYNIHKRYTNKVHTKSKNRQYLSFGRQPEAVLLPVPFGRKGCCSKIHKQGTYTSRVHEQGAIKSKKGLYLRDTWYMLLLQIAVLVVETGVIPRQCSFGTFSQRIAIYTKKGTQPRCTSKVTKMCD